MLAKRTTRWCGDCDQLKPRSAFHAPDWQRGKHRCAGCANALARAARDDHRTDEQRAALARLDDETLFDLERARLRVVAGLAHRYTGRTERRDRHATGHDREMAVNG